MRPSQLSESDRDGDRGAADDTSLSGIACEPRDVVLACPVDGPADTVVSRDKDLLSLGAIRGTPMRLKNN
jgi:hypothetical protein